MNIESSKSGNRFSFLYFKSLMLLTFPLMGLSFPVSSEANQLADLLQDSSHFLQVREAVSRVEKSPEIKEILKNNHFNSLTISQRLEGPTQIETTKFQHYYKGLEVIGSMAFHHRSATGNFIRNRIAHFDLDTNPSLTAETAASLAQSTSGNPQLKDAPQLEILPSTHQDSARLIYWVELKGKDTAGNQDVLVDAHSGQIIAKLSHAYSIAPIQIYSAKNQGIKLIPHEDSDPSTGKKTVSNCDLIDLSKNTQTTLQPKECMDIYQGESTATQSQCQIIDGLEGFPLDVNAHSCKQVVTNSVAIPHADKSVQNAAKNSSQVLNYYMNQFKRNSFDDKGSDLVSVIHAGEGMSNAYWMVDFDTMVYGDGDGKTMSDLTRAVDVTGHEMTHGITSHTAKLMMMGESGALNEAFSDFFGKMIENKEDWVIGRNLFLGAHAPKGIRDLQDPGSLTESILDEKGNTQEKPYPSKMSEAATASTSQTCDETNDRCWVHFNSTIPSHASYLVYKAIGKEKAEQLYYTTLTQNLSSTDNLQSATKAILNTCQQLNFANGDCDAVQAAYKEVGLL